MKARISLSTSASFERKEKWCASHNSTTRAAPAARRPDIGFWRLCLWCSYGAKSLALERFPRHVAPHVLPQALKPPDHVQLPVREMFEEAVRHQAGHVLPVAVPLVGKFFLQDGADRNHRS